MIILYIQSKIHLEENYYHQAKEPKPKSLTQAVICMEDGFSLSFDKSTEVDLRRATGSILGAPDPSSSVVVVAVIPLADALISVNPTERTLNRIYKNKRRFIRDESKK